MAANTDYPRMMFHRRKEPVTIHSREEEDALGDGWSRRIWPPEEPEPPEEEEEPDPQPEPEPEPEPGKQPSPPPRPAAKTPHTVVPKSGITGQREHFAEISQYLTGTPQTIAEISKNSGISFNRVKYGIMYARENGLVSESTVKAGGRIKSLYTRLGTTASKKKGEK